METVGLAFLASGFGVAFATLAVGIGIGRLGGSAVESIARQPEATGDIRTTMIIAAALIEGVCLFGLVICFLLGLK